MCCKSSDTDSVEEDFNGLCTASKFARDGEAACIGKRQLFLVAYSACGGMRTDKKVPVLTAYFPVLAPWKGWIVCGTTKIALLGYWALLPKLEQVVPIYN